MAAQLQDWIHRFEEGAGSTVVRRLLMLVSLVALGVFYNLAAFQNLSNPEGMDAAQLGRNLAEGRGYTTDFIRPLSLELVYRRATNQLASLSREKRGRDLETDTNGPPALATSWTAEEQVWMERLEGRHPDLAHPPIYPLLLAGVLRLNPFGYPNTGAVQDFSVYMPDLWIALFNQFLFLVAIWMLFGLSRQLFDEPVAWVTALVFAGGELYWRFTTSGLSTMVLIIIFLATVRVLAGLEEAARNPEIPFSKLLRSVVWVGILTGLGMMTRYAYGWLILPLASFLGVLGLLPQARRYQLIAVAGTAFLLVVSPWLTRNYLVSGQPLGVSGYALFSGTTSFPQTELERSVAPDFREFNKSELSDKLVKNLRILVQEDLPKLGGNWVSAFFLVGLLIPFRRPALGRVRTFIVACLGLLLLIQAMGRTWVSEESPVINTDNLLVVVAPVVFMYGVSLFFMLLDQFSARGQGVRYLSAGVFCLVVSAPLLLTFLPPGKSRVAYPPYYPPWIQEKAMFMEENDTMMSDIPWAVAWYGNRSSIWLSRDYRNPPATRYRNDFFAVDGRIRKVDALYISARTMEKVKTDSLYGWVSRADPGSSWEEFVSDWASFLLVGIYLNNEIPSGFPLKNAPRGIYPELFLVDSEHIEPKTIQ